MSYKKKISIILFIFCSLITYAQNKHIYKDLQNYGRFGFLVGPAFYQKAEVKPVFGEYTIEPKMATSFNAGFLYDFHPDKLWSFQTGFYIAHEPADYTDVPLYAHEYPGLSEDDIISNREKAAFSWSIPMTIRIQKRLGNKLYGQLKGGLRLMNFQTGSTSGSITINSDEESRSTVFYIESRTPETNYYASLLLGGGVSWASKWFLLRTDIMYVVNTQPTLEGRYIFTNMISDDSGGEIKMSGNHFALWLTFHIKRSKDR
ncbi:hypothetical protein [Lentimicrobium sp. S6]|uniref:hypothetical protein n=1 Tax=Lentimicrobium sp. S6 TaxID=2735872 RepID=UPI0015568602|nr:hypothetical protein [Lentimicrobium sp. S6]NPD47692.1 hypothetical protein [Lentimicrobium sp. S6]